jgi:hypothetical protein
LRFADPGIVIIIVSFIVTVSLDAHRSATVAAGAVRSAVSAA